jgi:hypothetical protein
MWLCIGDVSQTWNLRALTTSDTNYGRKRCAIVSVSRPRGGRGTHTRRSRRLWSLPRSARTRYILGYIVCPSRPCVVSCDQRWASASPIRRNILFTVETHRPLYDCWACGDVAEVRGRCGGFWWRILVAVVWKGRGDNFLWRPSFIHSPCAYALTLPQNLDAQNVYGDKRQC